MNTDGHTFGYYSFGLYQTVACVAIHNVQIGMNVRNYTPLMAGALCLNIALGFITVGLTELMPASALLKAMYS